MQTTVARSRFIITDFPPATTINMHSQQSSPTYERQRWHQLIDSSAASLCKRHEIVSTNYHHLGRSWRILLRSCKSVYQSSIRRHGKESKYQSVFWDCINLFTITCVFVGQMTAALLFIYKQARIRYTLRSRQSPKVTLDVHEEINNNESKFSLSLVYKKRRFYCDLFVYFF